MNEAIIKIWNNTVKPGDELWFLGDLDINGHRSFRDLTSKLNGKKHLISGNHDMSFEFKGQTQRVKNKIEKILSYGWESVQMQKVLQLKNGRNVLLSHLPYLDSENEQFDLRYKELRPKDRGMFLLHGHQHCHYIKSGRKIDVGFDGALKIWSEDEIIEMINDPRDFIESRITEFYKISKPRVLTE